MVGEPAVGVHLDRWEGDGDIELFLETCDDGLSEVFELWSFGVPVFWEFVVVAFFVEALGGCEDFGADDFVGFEEDVESALFAVGGFDVGAFSGEVTWVFALVFWELAVEGPGLAELDAVDFHRGLDDLLVEGEPAELDAGWLGVSDEEVVVGWGLVFVLVEECLELGVAWDWDALDEGFTLDQRCVNSDGIEAVFGSVHESEVGVCGKGFEEAIETIDSSCFGEGAVDIRFRCAGASCGEGDVALDRSFVLRSEGRDCLLELELGVELDSALLDLLLELEERVALCELWDPGLSFEGISDESRVLGLLGEEQPVELGGVSGTLFDAEAS